MADITGIINGSTSNSKIKSRIVWEETVDVLGNKGNVKATLQLRTTTGYVTSSDHGDFYITINGNKAQVLRTPTTLGPGDAWKTVFEHTVNNIAHNDDGTKAISISASGRLQGTSVSSITCGGTVQLFNIPRASAFSATARVEINGTNKVAVNITRKSNNHTHTVDIYTGDTYASATYKTRLTGVGTYAEYAIPTSWRLSMPTSMSRACKITVTTYNGATQIGDPVTAQFTIAVPANIKPVITAQNVTNSPKQEPDTSGFSAYVQGYSGVSASFGNQSALQSEVAIVETFIEYGGNKYTGNPAKTPTLNMFGSVPFVVGVKDARGQITRANRSVTFQKYSPPSLQNITVERSDQYGIADDVGTYIAVKVSALIESVNGENAVTVLRARYKSVGGAYGAWANLTSGETSVIGGGAVLITSSYDVEIEIKDTVGNESKITRRVATSEVSFHIRNGGKGLGIGKYGESDNLVDSAWPISAPGLHIKSYSSVSQLGLVPGEPTINDVFAAMPNNSKLLCDAAQFVSGDPPGLLGTVEIYRGTVGARSSLRFIGKTTGDADYRRYLASDGQSFMPTWYKMYDSSSAVPILGETTAAGIRNALGLGNTGGALPVANGGTGATNIAGIRAVIGLGAATSVDKSSSVATAEWTTIHSVSLTAGTYLVVCGAQWGSNTTGRRVGRIYRASDDYYFSRLSFAPTNGSATEGTMAAIIVLAATTTISFDLYQNSGASLACTVSVQTIKLA